MQFEPWCCQGSCLGPQLWSVLMSVSSVIMENKRIGLHRVVSAPQWLLHYDSEELALPLTSYSMHLSRVAQKSIGRSSSEQALKALEWERETHRLSQSGMCKGERPTLPPFPPHQLQTGKVGSKITRVGELIFPPQRL